MARRRFNPLDFVPRPEIVRQKLSETERLAERLRILLEVAERLRRVTAADPTTTKAKGGRADG
jgi:hypothetical protein